MQTRHAGKIIPKTYLQATAIMEYHRRMLHNFMVLNYVARNMISLHEERIPYEDNRVNLWSDEQDERKNPEDDTLNDVDMLKYILWLKRNYNNRTGRYRRFPNTFHKRHQELDIVNITGYALYQHPYKYVSNQILINVNYFLIWSLYMHIRIGVYI